MSNCLRPHGLWPVRLLCPWNSPGKNTGVDCYFLLQGIFLTQGLNPGLLHCRQILYVSLNDKTLKKELPQFSDHFLKCNNNSLILINT